MYLLGIEIMSLGQNMVKYKVDNRIYLYHLSFLIALFFFVILLLLFVIIDIAVTCTTSIKSTMMLIESREELRIILKVRFDLVVNHRIFICYFQSSLFIHKHRLIARGKL